MGPTGARCTRPLGGVSLDAKLLAKLNTLSTVMGPYYARRSEKILQEGLDLARGPYDVEWVHNVGVQYAQQNQQTKDFIWSSVLPSVFSTRRSHVI